jgi:hypothetical protein
MRQTTQFYVGNHKSSKKKCNFISFKITFCSETAWVQQTITRTHAAKIDILKVNWNCEHKERINEINCKSQKHREIRFEDDYFCSLQREVFAMCL